MKEVTMVKTFQVGHRFFCVAGIGLGGTHCRDRKGTCCHRRCQGKSRSSLQRPTPELGRGIRSKRQLVSGEGIAKGSAPQKKDLQAGRKSKRSPLAISRSSGLNPKTPSAAPASQNTFRDPTKTAPFSWPVLGELSVNQDPSHASFLAASRKADFKNEFARQRTKGARRAEPLQERETGGLCPASAPEDLLAGHHKRALSVASILKHWRGLVEIPHEICCQRIELLLETCEEAIHLKQEDTLRRLAHAGPGLFAAVARGFASVDKDLWLAATKILTLTAEHDPALLKCHLADVRAVVQQYRLGEALLMERDGPLRGALLRLMRGLLEVGEATSTGWLDGLYADVITQLVEPLKTAACGTEEGGDVSDGVEPEVLARSCSLLTYAVRHHGAKLRCIILTNGALEAVTAMAHYEPFLAVLAPRFLAACIDSGEAFRTRVREAGLYAPVMSALAADGGRDGALCAAVLELIERLVQNNLLADVRFLWDKHPTVFPVLSRADSSDKLPAILDVVRSFGVSEPTESRQGPSGTVCREYRLEISN